MKKPGIVVLDFGGQYAHLIANRVRRLRVYSEIKPPDVDAKALEGACGVILSGGPASVYDPDAPAFNAEALRLGLPVLGLCYGHQLLCQQLGGEVAPGATKEFGSAVLTVRSRSGVLEGLAGQETVWMSHGDAVRRLPDGFEVLGSTPDCPTAAAGDPVRRIYGLQFHPEVAHTPSGMRILDNFLTLCGCPRAWTMENYARTAMEEVRAQVGDRNVFLLVSGGVDSAVAFVLLNRALGEDRVLGLHIDNGFMRKRETALVREALLEQGFRNLRVVDASEAFLLDTEGLADPEAKRKAIGATFLRVKDRVLADLRLDPEAYLLGQGTLYPDTIESGGTRHAAVIKTHHNRIDLIEALIAEGKVVEPLAQLYKDEVRELGEALGLPKRLVRRHPFPGPGLAVRALCARGDERFEGLEEAQRQVEEIAARYGLKARILPLRSVGVQGDFRTYAHPAALWGEAGWWELERVSTEITNRVRAVNRTVYLIAPGDLPALRPKRAFLSRPRLDLLREADEVAMTALEAHGLMDAVSQMPTVLVPLSSDGQREAVVLRPVCTPDFMTARFAELPRPVVDEIAGRILALGGVDAVLYDVTHKPPGTIEWE